MNKYNRNMHYKDNWINGKNWSISDICQYQQEVRTNNDAERFHNNFNFKIQKTNVNFYELVGHLGEEAKLVNTVIKCLVSDRLSYSQKQKQKNFEYILKEHWRKLSQLEITPIQFLHSLNSMNVECD